MVKRILVTGGTVYGLLDDNKLVGNRIRGIWATRFARWLRYRGHEVTLLVGDIQKNEVIRMLDNSDEPAGTRRTPEIITHKGFWDYQEQCHMLAKTHDAAVMAAAVVNWIPKTPFPGKMPTSGYKPGDEMNIPFILAPRVIDGMRKANPKLTLIGCKMTIGATHDEMIEAAYHTLFWAKCHAVIANDQKGLRAKTVLYPDRAQFAFDIGAEEGENFYRHLEAIITDEHFATVGVAPKQAYDEAQLSNYRYVGGSYDECEDLFDRIADKYRLRFGHKIPINDREFTDHVFGSLAVRTGTGALCTPRMKNVLFSKCDAVDVLYPTADDLKQRRVRVIHHGMHEQRDGQWVESGKPVPKATMNATLLLRHLQAHPSASAVLHLHEQLPDRPTVPYAPPGTARDNLREIVGHAYNIEGHGCIISLDENGEMYGRWAQ
jgi:hypothetical protein